MNDRSLSSLYRRLICARPAADVGADDLAALAGGTLAEGRRADLAEHLATAPGHADLARMLRALRPHSEALASGVEQRRRGAVHPLRVRETAHARHAHFRRLRWAGALAACLVVALGVWSRHEDSALPQVAVSVRETPQTDRIFTSSDVIFAASGDRHGRTRASRNHGDELFRGNFSVGG
jgi:hypothetical protein